jgi:hypothetical protein
MKFEDVVSSAYTLDDVLSKIETMKTEH